MLLCGYATLRTNLICHVLSFYRIGIRGTLVIHIISINTTFAISKDVSHYHLWVQYCKQLGSVLTEHCLVVNLMLRHFFVNVNNTLVFHKC